MSGNAYEYLAHVRGLLEKATQYDKQGKYGEALYMYNSIASACQIQGKYKDLHPQFYNNLFKSASDRIKCLQNAGIVPEKPPEPSTISQILNQCIPVNAPNQSNTKPPTNKISQLKTQGQNQYSNNNFNNRLKQNQYSQPKNTNFNKNLAQNQVSQPQNNQSQFMRPQNAINQSNNSMAKQNSNGINVEKPKVTFKDIAGLENAKQSLYEAVIMPIKVPHLFDQAAQPWKGILLYGPPGTGKSFLAKAIAGEASNINFIAPSTSELTSKWVGESEKIIRSVFEEARRNKPSIIFFDEIDSLVPARGENDSETGRRIKTEFLIQMDGVNVDNQGVLIIAATNTPWDLDTAMRRRLEKRIYIPLPSANARLSLLQHKLESTPNSLTKDHFKWIVKQTKGFSGADLSILVRDALMQPIRKITKANYFKRGKAINKDGVVADNLWIPADDSTAANDPQCVHKKWNELNPDEIGKLPVTVKHFAISLKKAKPSVSPSDLEKYNQWTEEFGEEGA